MESLELVVVAAVRAERARRGWSQRGLAERLGWPVSRVSDLEAGRRRPRIDDLPLFCRVFDVSLRFLLGGVDSAADLLL